MLAALSGRSEVWTGWRWSRCRPGPARASRASGRACRTEVLFRELGEAEIAAYGEAAARQGRRLHPGGAAAFVARVGRLHQRVGLPLPLVGLPPPSAAELEARRARRARSWP
jgi:hypothetical protein